MSEARKARRRAQREERRRQIKALAYERKAQAHKAPDYDQAIYAGAARALLDAHALGQPCLLGVAETRALYLGTRQIETERRVAVAQRALGRHRSHGHGGLSRRRRERARVDVRASGNRALRVPLLRRDSVIPGPLDPSKATHVICVYGCQAEYLLTHCPPSQSARDVREGKRALLRVRADLAALQLDHERND